MKKKEIALGVVVYSDIVDNYEGLVDHIETFVSSGVVSWQAAPLGNGIEKYIDKDILDVDILTIGHPDKKDKDDQAEVLSFKKNLQSTFYKSFNLAEQDYNQEYGLACNSHERYSILKYKTGQSFGNHVDSDGDIKRIVSGVYYFNDDYVGGELTFHRLGITYKPKANDLVLFPSNYLYNHSISKVLEGTRYSMVYWIGNSITELYT